MQLCFCSPARFSSDPRQAKFRGGCYTLCTFVNKRLTTTFTCFLASGDRGGAGICARGPRVGESRAFGQSADHQRQPAL